MRIVMIGTGYVGLVSGACFADFGHDVTCVDKDPAKVEALLAGKIPIFEPGLDELVANNVAAGRLSFTLDIAEAVPGADAVFIAVGTPSRRGDGHADLSYVYAAAKEMAGHLRPGTVVVTKSTVPVGTGDEVERIIREARADLEFSVASNPEFLREGAAIEDFKRPDRIVVGINDEHARTELHEVYRPLIRNESPLLVMARRAAELTKYAANAFLATKITFINEIADLAEKVGADVQDIARGIGLDNRKRSMGRKVVHALDGETHGKTVGVLGLTFKPNTDDMRDSPSLAIVQALQDAGMRVRAFDPEGMEQAAKLLDGVTYCNDPYEALEGASAVVIVTEWDAFRALDFVRMGELLADKLLVDLRNVYDREEVERHGFRYVAVGR
jgi:UDPglucose 6-dehydrogenase